MCVRTVRGRHLLKCNLEWIRHAISCCSCVEFLMDFRKSNVHDFLKQILFLSRESAILLTHYREKEIKCVDISFPSRFFSFFNLVFVTKVEGDASKMNNNNSFSSACAFSRPAGHWPVRCEIAEGLVVLPIPTDWIISGEMKRSITHLEKKTQKE